MTRGIAVAGAAFLLAVLAAGIAWRGRPDTPITLSARAAAPSQTSQAGPSGQTPLYYQDPDGKPFYAAGPKKTASGRDYVPVYDDAASPLPDNLSHQTQSAASGQSPVRGRILYYRNPMGAPDTSPVPKKDPMGMDYLPVYENEAAETAAGVVAVPPGRLQTLGVRTAAVESRPSVMRSIRATGTLQFDERHLAVVTTRAGGWIERLHVAANGDPMRGGQVLAEIYAPDLVAAEEEYLVAARLSTSEGAHTTGHSSNPGALSAASLQRLRALNVPDDEIARLRRTGRASRLIAVVALEDGVVIDKPAVQGMHVSTNEPLYRTASLATMWLIAEIQEQDLGLIHPGQQARAEFVAFPGRSFTGTVDYIYPSLSPETRTARVRIVMPNPDGALRAGMYAAVTIEVPAETAQGPVVVVPSSAVIDSGAQQVVLVVRGEGRFEPRKVRVGQQGDGLAQILDGVKVGEQVVIGANFLIDAESNLRAALQSFAPVAGSNQTAGGGR
jgi:membrane fusion protein, copper/silver efflux system